MGFDGSSIEGFSRIQESDMVAIPDPSTFQLIPWKTEQPARADVLRHVQPGRDAVRRRPARRAQAPAAARGRPRLHVLRRTRARVLLLQGLEGSARSSTAAATSTRRRSTSPPTTASAPSQYLEAMGIPVEYVHHEVAPSQHEIDLRYTDALTMADNVMAYRLTVKEVAQEFGIYATFMPKPVAGRERQRHAHAPVAVRRATATRSSTPPTSTTCRRPPRATSPGCSATRRRSRWSPTSG